MTHCREPHHTGRLVDPENFADGGRPVSQHPDVGANILFEQSQDNQLGQ